MKTYTVEVKNIEVHLVTVKAKSEKAARLAAELEVLEGNWGCCDNEDSDCYDSMDATVKAKQ